MEEHDLDSQEQDQPRPSIETDGTNKNNEYHNPFKRRRTDGVSSDSESKNHATSHLPATDTHGKQK